MSGARLAGAASTLRDAARRVGGSRRDNAQPLLGADDGHELAAALAAASSAAPPTAPARRSHPGEGRSPQRGHGLDYAQSRAYQPGDDLRAMHWSLLARTGRPYVREYEAEQAAPWHALIDAHGGMLFGTRTRPKARQAARAATLAAGLQATLAPSSSLSLALWSGDGVHAREFGSGAGTTRRIAHWLMQQSIAPAPSAAAAPAPHALQGWARALQRLRPAPTRLLICSDFAWLDAAARAVLAALAARSALRCLWVSDPVELGLPQLPGARWVDATRASEAWLATDDAPRRAFAQLAAQHRERRLAELRGLGARVAQVLSAESALALRETLRELQR